MPHPASGLGSSDGNRPLQLRAELNQIMGDDVSRAELDAWSSHP